MLKIIRLFFTTKEASPFLLVGCMLLASLAETIGIGTLLPILSMAMGVESPGAATVSYYVNGLLGWLGLPVSLGSLVFLVAAFMLLKALLTFSALAYAAVAAARVSLSIRRRLLTSIFNARWGFFSEQKSGALSSLMGAESSRAGEAFVISATVVSTAIQAVAYAAVAVVVNWKLAILGVGTGLLMAVLLQGFVLVSRSAAYKLTDRTKSLLGDMVDALANIKPMKSMHRYDAMVASIGKTFKKLKRAFVAREWARSGLNQASTSIVAVVAAVGIYVASTFLAVPFPDLLVSAIVFNQITSISSKLQRNLQMAVEFESSYVRTTEMIAQAEAARELNPGREIPQAGASCRFENVNFAHGETPVLSDVSLEIPAGAITVLSGPSGAGKTTIIDLLIGLHRAASGRILIGDIPIEQVDLVAWRHMIGYVPQELSLFHTTIRDNLTLGDTTVSDERLLAALAQAGAADFIAQLPNGLDTDVGAMGSKLSGGQRQRISLARALVADPKILVLDEVTSALDPETEAEIVSNIAGLRGAYTIVAITHRPAWTAIADRLFLVSAGRVTPQLLPPARA